MQSPVRDNTPPLVRYATLPRQRWYQKRWVKPIALAALALAICATVALPAWRSWKTWRARRLASAASALVQANDFQKAYTFVQQADHYGPNDPYVQGIKGRFLLKAHAYAPSIVVWEKIARSRAGLTPDNRRDYAAAAYELGRLPLVAEQLRILRKEVPAGSATDSLLSARLGERTGDRLAAVKNALKVFNYPLASASERYDAAILLLNNAEDLPSRQAAWNALNKLAEGNDAVALQSLAYLATQQLTPSVSSAGKEGLATNIPALIQRLELHPLASSGVRLGILELRYKLDPSQGQALVTKAIADYKNGDDATVTALCRWLLSHQGAAEAVKILPLDRAVKSRTLLAARMEALAAVGEWGIIEKDLSDPAVSGKLDDVLPPLYLARSATRLGKPVASEVNWDRALSVAGEDRRKLLIVGQVAESEHQSDRAEAAYRAIVAAAPNDLTSYPPLLRFLTERGGAAATHLVLVGMVKRWPEDAALQISEAYTGLLSGTVTPGDAREAMEKITHSIPANSGTRAVMALAMLQGGQAEAALEQFGDSFDPGPPSSAQPALIVHAAVLAAAGRVEDAKREAMTIAGTRKMLPEERALLQPLLASN